MSADQHNRKPAAGAPEQPAPQPNSTKVRSTQYDWAHDIGPAEPPEKSRNENIAARNSLFRRLLEWMRDLFRSGRNPFDRDNGPDPMTA